MGKGGLSIELDTMNLYTIILIASPTIKPGCSGIQAFYIKLEAECCCPLR